MAATLRERLPDAIATIGACTDLTASGESHRTRAAVDRNVTAAAVALYVRNYLPAGQAVWQSFQLEDAFGTSTQFVGFENYVELFKQPEYFKAMGVTLVSHAALAMW